MRNIAIFASGAGTNAENIIKYFSNNRTAKVNLILSNRPEAYVLKRAEAHHIKSLIFDRHTFYHTDIILDRLRENKVDFIVLAGFLWIVPDNIIGFYDKRIVNIHPALLPRRSLPTRKKSPE
jgi:phosphoribosylglycinamide formyltransferase-1